MIPSPFLLHTSPLTPSPLTPSQVGMVAWRLKLRTPQYPEGREVVLIANDITHQIGSFGPPEDQLFQVGGAMRSDDTLQ